MLEAELTVIGRRLDLVELPSQFALLLDYWRAKRNGRRMPARGDIDPVDLRFALGRLALIEIHPSPPRFVFRIWGSDISHRRFGPRDRKPTSEVRPRRYVAAAEQHYELARELREPLLHEMTLGFREHRVTYQRLVLPLAKDGETPDMLLLGTTVDRRRATDLFEAYFEAEEAA